MFLKLSQNSQENTCVRVSFLIKLQAWGQNIYLWWLLQVFLQNTSGGCFWQFLSKESDSKHQIAYSTAWYELKSMRTAVSTWTYPGLPYKLSSKNQHIFRFWFFNENFDNLPQKFVLDTLLFKLFIWIIHLVRTQNFSKKWHFLPPDTYTDKCVSGGKKC